MSRATPTRTWFSLIRFPLLTLACGAGCWLALGSPAAAQWFGKKFLRKPTAAAAPTNDQGFAGYIRRLSIEAQTAANRGDYETALNLAERAHKVSLTCQSMLANDADCAPAALESQVERYRAAKNDEPASAVNPEDPKGPIDLTPLLDRTAAESQLPIPPTPAASRRKKSHGPTAASQPQIAAAKPRASATKPKAVASKLQAVAAKPQVRAPKPQVAASKPLAGDPLTTIAAKPAVETPSVPTAREAREIVLASDSLPQKFTRRKAARAPEGYLVRQSRWFNPEADTRELIDDASPQTSVQQTSQIAREERQPGRATLNSTPARRHPPRAEAPKEDAEIKPAIATADQAGERWQLDIDHTASPARATRRPVQAETAERAFAPRSIQRTETTIGVWQSTEAPIVRASDTPGMIETDFRHVTGGDLSWNADEPRTLNPPPVSRPTLAPTIDGPAVRYRDDATSEWDAGELLDVETAPVSAAAIPLLAGDWTPGRQTLLIGIVLVIAGLALFGLSFRWK